jgi:hypothetical protein
MDGHSKRSRHNKTRKPRPIALRPIISGEISSQFHHPSDNLTARSSGSADIDRLNDIIDDITSEGDDARVGPSSKLRRESKSNLVEPNSPPINDNHSSLYTLPSANDSYRDRTSSSVRSGRKKFSGKDKKLNQLSVKKSYSPSRSNNFDDRTDSTNRRKSIGDIRRQQLTECMEYYRHCLESAQHSNTICMNDDPTNTDKRKQYATTLWYELKRYFNGINPSDENGIELEQSSIEHQRKQYLDEFYLQFTRCNSERSRLPYDNSRIQRHILSDLHLTYCNELDKSLGNLFAKWDQILSLFPSYAALEQYDKRFDSRTKEGRMFYEELSVCQAWFNLNSEINRLIVVLGRIIACTQCQIWPDVTCSSAPKLNDNATINASRPPTPSSTSSSELKDTISGSPSNSSNYLLNQTSLKQQFSTVSNSSRMSTSSSFSTTPETTTKRQHTITSVSSMDNIHQLLTPTSPLAEFYYR